MGAVPAVPGMMASGLNLNIEQSQHVAVKWALREIVRNIQVRDIWPGSPTEGQMVAIFPSTTLVGDHPAGTTALTVATPHGPKQFLAEGYVDFYDLTDEEHIEIDAAWDMQTSPVPLAFRNVGYTGTRFDHPDGTPVGTNLYMENPPNLDHMMDRGAPILFISTITHQRVRGEAGSGYMESSYMFRIEFRLAETQPVVNPADTSTLMPDMVWSSRIQKRAEVAMEAIADALERNWALMTPLGEVGIGQTDPTNPTGQVWRVDWTSVIVNGTQLQFAAAGVLPIRARWKWISTYEGAPV